MIRQLIKRLQKTTKRTMLNILHNKNEASRTIKKVVYRKEAGGQPSFLFTVFLRLAFLRYQQFVTDTALRACAAYGHIRACVSWVIHNGFAFTSPLLGHTLRGPGMLIQVLSLTDPLYT